MTTTSRAVCLNRISMKRIAILAVIACSLGGCASVPLATGLAIGSLSVAAGSLAIATYHNCRADGGCKTPLPK